MTPLDYCVIGIVAVSSLLGLVRGAVRELLSLLAWVAAYLAAKMFAESATRWVPAQLENPALRHAVGFVLVFILVMVLAMLISLLLSASIKAMGLGLGDSLLGLIFGSLRGMAIVMILVLLAGLTTLPRSPIWRQSLFAPYLVRLAAMAEPWLPDDFVKHLQF
ncbi:MAG TPA: CvpA family protein [Burkholderiales bacterium]|nr:CvpA family protein [Burkholderiales bacterium]